MLQLLDPLPGQLELLVRSFLRLLDECVNHDDARRVLLALTPHNYLHDLRCERDVHLSALKTREENLIAAPERVQNFV